jgi:release factor glutamine methyltransferase
VPSPTSVAKVLSQASSRLADAGIESARLEARLLLEIAARMSRLEILQDPARTLSKEPAAAFEALLNRRLRREPLAYIRGTQEFYGIEMEVSPAVLIPRPETEMLVEFALEKLGDSPEPIVVDVGTGSGCIAIAVAKHAPQARVLAVDLSPEALAVTKRNVERHAVSDRVTLVRGDLLGGIRERTGEVVVSNPPYIPSSDVEELQEEVRRHEPRLALDGGADGFAIHRRLISQAARVLRPGGWIGIEVAMGQAGEMESLLRDQGWAEVGARDDLAGIPRIVTAQLP